MNGSSSAAMMSPISKIQTPIKNHNNTIDLRTPTAALRAGIDSKMTSSPDPKR